MAAMKAALLKEGIGNGVGWTLFGGEALLLPINDLEDLLQWSSARKAPVSVQTNGTILTPRHIALFLKHRVSVGMSLDGPDALNDAREAVDPKATRSTTALSERNLWKLLSAHISVSLIVTLTSVNAGDAAKVERLIEWIRKLKDAGLRAVNFHTLEPHGDVALALSQAWQIEVLTRLSVLHTNTFHVNPFNDIRKALLQQSGTNCIWNFCDPYTTPAVRGIDGSGASGNCGRTNKNGVGYAKADRAGHERQLALYLTPKEDGGCGGCRFFLACGGGNCPGEGENGDWRARTVHCETLTALFTHNERELFLNGQEPISMSLRRPALEAQRIAEWRSSVSGHSTFSNHEHGDKPHGDRAHGDHDDTPPV